jgi:hypothetical protein
VTWVIDVSVDCACGAWTVAFGTVSGDGRRLLAPASRRAFPPSLSVPIAYRGGVTTKRLPSIKLRVVWMRAHP